MLLIGEAKPYNEGRMISTKLKGIIVLKNAKI